MHEGKCRVHMLGSLREGFKTSLIRSPEGRIIGCSESKPLSLFPLSRQPVLSRTVVLCGPDTWHQFLNSTNKAY